MDRKDKYIAFLREHIKAADEHIVDLIKELGEMESRVIELEEKIKQA